MIRVRVGGHQRKRGISGVDSTIVKGRSSGSLSKSISREEKKGVIMVESI